MVAAIDFDIDNAEGFDRTPSPPVGIFEVDIATLEHFETGVGADGKVIPGKKQGQAVSCKFDIVEVINQKASAEGDPGFDKEVGEYPPPSLVAVGERRGWFCNVEHEQNRKRLRHLVQAALGFAPDGPEALAAVDDEGNAVKWGDELKAAIAEDNPLAGKRMRVQISRVVTKKGLGNVMYVPTFMVSHRTDE